MSRKPLTQEERSQRLDAKRKKLGEEKIALTFTSGVRETLESLMVLAGIEEYAEAITLAIHHLHGRGRRGAPQTLEYQRAIGEPKRTEKLDFRARPGTIQAMSELMQWAGIETRSEFVEVLILRMSKLGEDALPLLESPSHEIKVCENVAYLIWEKGRRASLALGLDE